MKPYYERAGITLYHARCEEVLPALSGIDLVFTSPPYNMAITSHGTANGGGFHRQSRVAKGGRFADGYGLHGDGLSQCEYDAWQRRVLALLWAAVSDTGAIFYNHRPRVENGALRLPLSMDFGLPLGQIVVWDRGTNGIDIGHAHFSTAYEWILLFTKPGFRLAGLEASGMGNLWRIGIEPNRTEHPAPFPVALPAKAIAATTAALVLDPFAGVGSTLIAAKKLGRAGIGIEREERWCEVAARRLDATPEPLPYEVAAQPTFALWEGAS